MIASPNIQRSQSESAVVRVSEYIVRQAPPLAQFFWGLVYMAILGRTGKIKHTVINVTLNKNILKKEVSS